MAEERPTQFRGAVLADEFFARDKGESDAIGKISVAKLRANALAARLLAESECPEDLKVWGQQHNIPTFSEVTWQAGFAAGMRVAMLDSVALPQTTDED